MKRIPMIMLIIFLIIVIGTGCKNGEKLQSEVQSALDKQKEVTSYTFSGNAEVSLASLPLTKNATPATAGLYTLIKDSNLEWTGIASQDPVRLEAEFKLTPKGTHTTFTLPVLIKDNQLFFNIPLINEPEQYYMIDLAELSDHTNNENPLTPDKLSNISHLLTSLTSMLVEGMEPQWFEKVKSEADNNGQTITVEINEENQAVMVDSLFSKLPEMIEEMQASGLLTETQASEIKRANINPESKEKVASAIISQPWNFSATINDDGFIQQLAVDLHFNSSHIRIQNHYDNINSIPSFTKEVPENIKSFADVLNLLSTAK